MKHWTYWSSVNLIIIITVLEAVFYYQSELMVYFFVSSSILITAGVFSWVYFDGRERGTYLTWGFKYALLFLGPFAVPFYFAKTRGYRKSLVSGCGLILYLPYYAFYYATWYVTVTILENMGYYG